MIAAERGDGQATEERSVARLSVSSGQEFTEGIEEC
jgi:hypothetical protein